MCVYIYIHMFVCVCIYVCICIWSLKPYSEKRCQNLNIRIRKILKIRPLSLHLTHRGIDLSLDDLEHPRWDVLKPEKALDRNPKL